MKRVKVLFVCMGNICRSPTAHAVFRKIAKTNDFDDRIEVTSAGTHAYHVGESPDDRAQEVALSRGISMGDLRAQKITPQDVSYHDFVIAMDYDNYEIIKNMVDKKYHDKICLFMEFARMDWSTQEVPDPYFGGHKGFEQVFDMITDASEGLLAKIEEML